MAQKRNVYVDIFKDNHFDEACRYYDEEYSFAYKLNFRMILEREDYYKRKYQRDDVR